MYPFWLDSCRLWSKVISCQINFFFAVAVVTRRAQTPHPMVFREPFARQSSNRFAEPAGISRGAYAFNRIVNPFLSSVRAEQLENCMQMQKYSGENARAPWFLIDSRRALFLSPPVLLSDPSSFARFYIFRLLVFSTTCSLSLSLSLFLLIRRSRDVIRWGRETKFWSRYALFSFLWFWNGVLFEICVCVSMTLGSIGPLRI